MEIIIVFVIFGVALASLIAYLRHAFNEGDGCSKCSGASSCGARSKRGKCC